MKRLHTIQLILVILSGSITATKTTFAQEKISLNLPSFLNEVQKSNLGYIAEQFNISVTEAELEASKIFPDPEISLMYSNSEDKKLQMGQSFETGLSYPVNLGNRRKASMQLSKSQLELQQLVVESYFKNLRADASKSFFAALKELKTFELENEIYQQFYKLAQSDSLRLVFGEANSIDAMQSNLEAKSQLNQVFQSEVEMKNSIANLTYLTGKSNVNANYLPVGNFPVSGREYSLTALIDSALQNRTDLMLAIKNKEVSEKNVELLNANRAFEFNLEAGYSYNTLVRNEIAPAPKHNSFNAGLTIPLKFSNLNKGSVNAAKLLVSQKEAIYSDIQLQVTTEVTRAFNNYSGLKKQVEHYNKGLTEMAEKILNGRIFSYQRGETGLVDVLNAQKTYTSLRKDFLNVQYEYVLSLIELQYATGIWEF